MICSGKVRRHFPESFRCWGPQLAIHLTGCDGACLNRACPRRVSEGFRSVCRKRICHADVIPVLPHKDFGEKGALQRACLELVCTKAKLWHLKSCRHEERRGNRFSSHRHIELAAENSSPNGTSCVRNSCPAGSGPVFHKPDSNYFRSFPLHFPGIAIPVAYCCS